MLAKYTLSMSKKQEYHIDLSCRAAIKIIKAYLFSVLDEPLDGSFR